MSDQPTSDAVPSTTDAIAILKGIVYGQIRTWLAVGFGGLAAHGVLTGSQSQAMVGVVLALIPSGWSALDKVWLAQKHNLALLAAGAEAKLAAQLGVKLPGPGAAVAIAFLIASLALHGCGTPFGIATANVLESSVNKALVSAAVGLGTQAGLASLESKGNIPPEAAAQFNAVATTTAQNVTSGWIDFLASLLRGQQGTPAAASQSAIAAVMTKAGCPRSVATAISSSVANLQKAGIPADAANEAVAATLNAVAAAKSSASPAATPMTGAKRWEEDGWTRLRCASPWQTRSPAFRTALPGLRALEANPPAYQRLLYTPGDQPIYPLIVTRLGN